MLICPAQYFNQRLLNFNMHFASDADYIFFARSAHEQYHPRSSIYFAMHKTKLGTLTPETVKSNFKGTIEKFVARDNAFSFMSSVKGPPRGESRLQIGVRQSFLIQAPTN